MLATIEACEHFAADYMAQGQIAAARTCIIQRAQLRDAQPSSAESDALAVAFAEAAH